MTDKSNVEQLRQTFGASIVESIEIHALAPRERLPEILAAHGIEQVGDGFQIAAHPAVPGSDAVVRAFTASSPAEKVAAALNGRFVRLEAERTHVLRALVAAGNTDAGADPDSVELVEMIVAAVDAEKQLAHEKAKQEALQEICTKIFKPMSSKEPEPDVDLKEKRAQMDTAKKKAEDKEKEVAGVRATAEGGHIFRRARAMLRLAREEALLAEMTRRWLEAIEEAAAAELEYEKKLARWNGAQQEKEAQRAAAGQLLAQTETTIKDLETTIAAPEWKMKEKNATTKAVRNANLAVAKAKEAQHAATERQVRDARELRSQAKKLATQSKADADRAESHKKKARSKTPGGRARKAANDGQRAVDDVKIASSSAGSEPGLDGSLRSYSAIQEAKKQERSRDTSHTLPTR